MAQQFGRLLWKIEGGHELDESERRFLADLIRAQIKRPAHRPAGDPLRRRTVAMTVLNFEFEHDCKREAAVAEAMRIHKVSRKYVFDALSEIRNLPLGRRTINVAGEETRFVLTPDGEWRKVD